MLHAAAQFGQYPTPLTIESKGDLKMRSLLLTLFLLLGVGAVLMASSIDLTRAGSSPGPSPTPPANGTAPNEAFNSYDPNFDYNGYYNSNSANTPRNRSNTNRPHRVRPKANVNE